MDKPAISAHDGVDDQKGSRVMCHGHIDPNILMIEVEQRYRAAQQRPEESHGAPGLPPELMGGWAGVFARLSARFAGLFPRTARSASRPATHPAE